MKTSQQKDEPKKCVTCGARVTGWNPTADTCDTTCTRAKHARRTRGEQIAYEIEQEQTRWADEEHEAQQYERDHPYDGGLECANRPYLDAQFA